MRAVRIYFADNKFLIQSGFWEQLGMQRLLNSFFYILTQGDGHLRELVEEIGVRQPQRPDIFLDSGAFSAWTRGVTIDLQEYINFVHEWKTHLTVYANLDVIGDPAATWANQQEMEKQGLSPLPCYHVARGEPLSWLKKYLDRYEYLALGGMGSRDRTISQMQRHLDEIFALLCDPKGLPRVKVHGFAMTSEKLMLRFPWFSVDSTSWVLTGRFGACFVPLNGKIHKVVFSSDSPRIRDAGKHYSTYPKIEQREIGRWLAEIGFSPEELRTVYQKRDQANIKFFLWLEKNWKVRPFKRSDVQPVFGIE